MIELSIQIEILPKSPLSFEIVFCVLRQNLRVNSDGTHGMGRNYLAHTQGDAILAAAGYNFRLLLTWLRLLLRLFLAMLFGGFKQIGRAHV